MSIVSKSPSILSFICSKTCFKSVATLTTSSVQGQKVDKKSIKTPKVSDEEQFSNFKATFPTCIKTTKIEICGQLYQSLKEKGFKLYQDVPINGIETEATFFDNSSIVSRGSVSSIPTVVIFPGSPGYIHHFSSLIGHLTSQGVRVVSLNFPTFQLTRATKYFRHSPRERVEFAKAILKEAGVSRIDLLTSHSSGTFSSLHFWKEARDVEASEASNFQDSDFFIPEVKSLSLFNPLGFEVTVPMTPYWFTSRFVKYYQRNGPRFFLEKFGLPILVALGNPFVRNKLDDIVWGGCCLHYNDREEMKKIITQIVDAKVPRLIQISDNDSVMNKKMNAVLMKAFGGNADAETIFDKEGSCEKFGSYQEEDIKIIRSRSGGHFSFIKYADAVNQAVTDHLERVLLNEARKREEKGVVRNLASDSEQQSDSESEDWASVRKVAKSARFNFAQ